MPAEPIPTTMRALQLDHFGGIDALHLVEKPVPRPGPGEVLVRMSAAPANPSDLHFLKGEYRADIPLPTVPGFEGAGRVVAAGRGLIGRLWLGRRVACGLGHGGTWAEYAVTEALTCFPLLGGISDEQGAMLIINPITALALLDLARKAGARAIVQTAAAGQVGRMVLRLAQRYGLQSVHVVRRAEQATMLRELGAQYVLDSSAPDFLAQLRELCQRLDVTYALDAVGGAMTRQLLDALPRGTVNVYGLLANAESTVDTRAMLFGEKRLETFWLPVWAEGISLLRTVWLAVQAQRWAARMFPAAVQGRYPLGEALDGLRQYSAHMTDGKILLLPGV